MTLFLTQLLLPDIHTYVFVISLKFLRVAETRTNVGILYLVQFCQMASHNKRIGLIATHCKP